MEWRQWKEPNVLLETARQNYDSRSAADHGNKVISMLSASVDNDFTIGPSRPIILSEYQHALSCAVCSLVCLRYDE